MYRAGASRRWDRDTPGYGAGQSIAQRTTGSIVIAGHQYAFGFAGSARHGHCGHERGRSDARRGTDDRQHDRGKAPHDRDRRTRAAHRRPRRGAWGKMTLRTRLAKLEVVVGGRVPTEREFCDAMNLCSRHFEAIVWPEI